MFSIRLTCLTLGAQMNCVPGMITEFAFTPTVTTEEIRQTDAMRAKVKRLIKLEEKIVKH